MVARPVGLGTIVNTGTGPRGQITGTLYNDANRNNTPDCDLLNPAAQTVTNGDICGAMANANFGKVVPGSTYDRNLLTGWGAR